MKRKLNFNSGPSALPDEVLQHASEAVIEYNKSGLSILEIPHRGRDYEAINDESRQLVKELCGLSDDYEVLWLHGGGRLQFCMIPMNFLGQQDTAGYIVSGHWAEEAFEYATRYGNAQILATSKEENYHKLPTWPTDISDQLAYVHYTSNNTVYGTQRWGVPDCNVPLIADVSSDIFALKRDYSKCAMFYAVAQKNIGTAGATLAVIHKDMLQRIRRDMPPMLNYNAHAEKDSILNTPPVYAVYVSLLMLRWTKAKGIEAIEKENLQKSKLLYDELERNKKFKLTVTRKQDRSITNVCFSAKTIAGAKAFTELCTKNNITGIKGHKLAGGFRVALYNAVPLKNVKRLVQVMQEFEGL
jgi:phosphoserine aminotransferase